MEVRRKSLARKIVRECYRVKKGDMVLISTDRNILDLAMPVGVECIKLSNTGDYCDFFRVFIFLL